MSENDNFLETVERVIPADMRAIWPGLVKCFVPHGEGRFLVERSRFDGDYGSVTRVTPVAADNAVGVMVIVPTDLVTAALAESEPGSALDKVYLEWRK